MRTTVELLVAIDSLHYTYGIVYASCNEGTF